MLLLDRAIKMAAELDEPEEMNFVRKHARQQAEELGLKNLRDAAVRVFSNSSGERGRVHKGRGSGGLAAKASRESSSVQHVYKTLLAILTSRAHIHFPPLPPLRLILFEREPGC